MFKQLNKQLKGLFSLQIDKSKDKPSPPPEDAGSLRVVTTYLTVHSLKGNYKGDGDVYVRLGLELAGYPKKVQTTSMEILTLRPRSCKDIRWNSTHKLSIFLAEDIPKEEEKEISIVFELWEKSLTAHLMTFKCSLSLSVLLGAKEGELVPVYFRRERPSIPSGLGKLPVLSPEKSKPSVGEKSEGKTYVTISRAPPPMKRKLIYFVRHGESKWNLASANRDIVGLVKEVDHSLSLEGKHQCLDLQDKIYSGEKFLRDEKNPKSSPKESPKRKAYLKQEFSEFERRFFSAKRVYSSPLTRALLTSLIGLAYHPLFKIEAPTGPKRPESPAQENGGETKEGKEGKGEESTGEIEEKKNDKRTSRVTLLSSAREKRNFGGLDTQGKSFGDQIPVRAEKELRLLFGEQGIPRHVRQMIKYIDVNDCTYPWWNSAKESQNSFDRRLTQFCDFLQYDPNEEIIMVGHSHFIRGFVRRYLSKSFSKKNPKLAKDLTTHVVENCGILGLVMEFSPEKHPQISDMKLMFGSKIKIKNPNADKKTNLLGGVLNSVQGYMRRQQENRAARRSERLKKNEEEWWFALLKEMNPDAQEDHYQVTHVRKETMTWNRQLLNMHLGPAYYKLIQECNPVAIKKWYFLETKIEAEDASEEELDLMLTPWDIEALYSDLRGFGKVQTERRKSFSSRSRSRSRGKEERSDSNRSSAPNSFKEAAQHLGIPKLFNFSKSEAPETEIKVKDIPKSLYILKLELKDKETKDKNESVQPFLGQYNFCTPGIWRHVDRPGLSIFIRIPPPRSPRASREAPERISICLGEEGSHSIAVALPSYSKISEISEKSLSSTKFLETKNNENLNLKIHTLSK